MVKLFAPLVYGDQPCSFHFATPDQKADATGGCGPGGMGDLLVPDTLWGLSVRRSCQIHDWMYTFGETEDDKTRADLIFLNNMVREIKAAKSWGLLENLRLHRAKIYYHAVSIFGGSSFHDSSNDPEEMS